MVTAEAVHFFTSEQRLAVRLRFGQPRLTSIYLETLPEDFLAKYQYTWKSMDGVRWNPAKSDQFRDIDCHKVLEYELWEYIQDESNKALTGHTQ